MPSFLKDLSNSTSRVLANCIYCRDRNTKSTNKRKVLDILNPNIPTKKHSTRFETPSTDQKLSIIPPNPLLTELENPTGLPTLPPVPLLPEPSVRAPIPPPVLPPTPGFLPTDQ